MVVEIHSLPSSNQDDQATGDEALQTISADNPVMEEEVDKNEELVMSTNPDALILTASEDMQTPSQDKALSLKRQRGGQPGRKKGDPRINKPRTADSCIKNRCVVESAMFFFHSEVMPLLNHEQIQVLSTTPFMHLFAFPNKTQANNAILHSILLMWDSVKGGFWYSNKLLKFTPDEVALVMGLGFEGEVVVYKRESLTNSNLRHKFFQKRNEKITRKELEDTIIAAILNNNSTAQEIVGLLVMYIFTTILFPQTSGNVPIHLFPYVENIDRLKKYNWGEGVYRMLMENIPNNALWCQLKRDELRAGKAVVDSPESLVCANPGNQEKVSGTLPGCAIALIAWFFEHVEVPRIRIFRGHIPRFFNWKLHIGWRRDSFNRKLDLVKTSDVKSDALEWSSSELLFKMEGLVFNFYVSCLNRAEQLMKTQNLHLYKLVLEMTPIYMLFKFQICNELAGSCAPHMIEDLKYVEECSTDLPKLSPASEQKVIAQVAHEEWKHEIKKKSIRRQAGASEDKQKSPDKGKKSGLKKETGASQDKKKSSGKAKILGLNKETGASQDKKKPPGKAKVLGLPAFKEEKKHLKNKPDAPKAVYTRRAAKLIDETPESPLKSRVLYNLTPTPDIGKDAPVKKRKMEEKDEDGDDERTQSDGEVGFVQSRSEEEYCEPDDDVQLTQDVRGIKSVEKPLEPQLGMPSGGVITTNTNQMSGKDADDVVKNVLDDIKKVEEKKGVDKEASLKTGGQEELEEQVDQQTGGGEAVLQTPEENLGGDIQGDKGGIAGGEGKGEQGFDSAMNTSPINLGEEHPHFSLGIGLTPPPPKIDKERVAAKEQQILPVRPSNFSGRPKLHIKRAGLKGVTQEASNLTNNIIEISSQEQESPARKKAVMLKRIVKRRVQPKRNQVDKDPFVGEVFIHDDAKEILCFKDWIQACFFHYEIDEIEGVPFRYLEDHPNWDFCNDSLFIDPDFVQLTEKVPLPRKIWEYENRDLVSDTVSNILDDWVVRYFKGTILDDDYPFRNNAADLFMLPDHFKDLLFSCNDIGPEVVEIAAFLLQRDTPVKNDEEWFYLTGKALDIGPVNPMMKLFPAQRNLFSEQFERAKWLFVPLCAQKHWILVAIDLPTKKILLYNSLKDQSLNQYYFGSHRNTMHWVKYFLSWRLGDEEWNNVDYTWVDCPTQKDSNDCAIFVIRIMDCLSRNVPFDFDQAMICKERLLLAFRILVDDRNDLKFVPNM